MTAGPAEVAVSGDGTPGLPRLNRVSQQSGTSTTPPPTPDCLANGSGRTTPNGTGDD